MKTDSDGKLCVHLPMNEASAKRTPIRFASFELDEHTRELRKGRVRLRLPDQSIEVLIALLERPGELVTRDELRHRLWATDTFVDFDHGLNAAVRRLREALGDSAVSSRFVETLPRRGYRFIGSLTRGPSPAESEHLEAKPVLPVTDSLTHLPAPLGPSEPADAVGPAVSRPGERERPTIRFVAIAMSLLLLTLLSGLAAGPMLDRRAAGTPFGNPAPALSRLTFEPGLQTDPSLSPDGRLVAYAANTTGNFDIWVRPVSGGDPIRLTTDLAHDWQPDWSPDGTRIIFRSERGGGGLFTIGARGDAEHQLTRSGYRPRWSPAGSHIAFVHSVAQGTALKLSVATGSGGSIATLEGLTERERRAAFAWHPDGRRIAVMGSEGPDPFWLLTINAGSGEVQRWTVAANVQRTFAEHRLVVPRHHTFAWDTKRDVIYFVADSRGLFNVWALEADSRAGRIVGGPHRLTTNEEGAASLALSRDGRRIVFDAATRRSRIWVYPLDPSGLAAADDSRAISEASAHAYSPDLSPDGKRVVFLRQHPGAGTGRDLVLHSLVDGAERVLRVEDSGRGETRGPVLRWAPDGSRIAYRYVLPDSPIRQGEVTAFGAFQQIRTYTFNSEREADVTSPAQAVEGPFGWSADGRHLITAGNRYGEGGFAIARTPLHAAPRAEAHAAILATSKSEALWESSPSPDGRWIVATAEDGDRSRLIVLPASGGAVRDLTDGWSWDDKPRWAADGSAIYFISGRGGIFNVWALPFDSASGRSAGDPIPVTHFDGPGEQILPDVGRMEMSVRARRLVIPVIHPVGSLWMLDDILP